MCLFPFVILPKCCSAEAQPSLSIYAQMDSSGAVMLCKQVVPWFSSFSTSVHCFLQNALTAPSLDYLWCSGEGWNLAEPLECAWSFQYWVSIGHVGNPASVLMLFALSYQGMSLIILQSKVKGRKCFSQSQYFSSRKLGVFRVSIIFCCSKGSSFHAQTCLPWDF